MSKKLTLCFIMLFIISIFAFFPHAAVLAPHTVELSEASVMITLNKPAGNMTIAQGADSVVVSAQTPIIIDGAGTGPANKSNTVTIINNSLDPLNEAQINVTLKDAYIDASDTVDGCAFFIRSNVKCNLFLEGEIILKSGVRRAALEVSGASPKASVAISGTGTANIYGGDLAVGIGSSFDG
ncbi:MAG TPA: hypothetical protein PLZ84_04355, partial [Clostridia bacterium]|nr:hypothetical protein [Clostridia bacterium]